MQIHLISRLFNHQFFVVIQLNSICNSMTDKSEDGTDVQCEGTAFVQDINFGCMRGCREGLILRQSSRQSCFNNAGFSFVCLNASLLKECEDSAFVSINYTHLTYHNIIQVENAEYCTKPLLQNSE